MPKFPVLPAGQTTLGCFHCQQPVLAAPAAVHASGYPPGRGEFVTAPCPACGFRTYFDPEKEPAPDAAQP